MSRPLSTLPRTSMDEGQALVEMAVVLPVFCLLLFGIFAFAIGLFGYCNITFAARAAVRYASIHSTTSLVPATPAKVAAVVAPYLVAASISGTSTNVSYTPSNTIGSTVIVTVTARYAVTVPFATLSSFTVSSAAQRTITR